MTDYVRSMIARQLGVPQRCIGLWRVTAGSGSRSGSGPLGGYNVPTRLEAELEVQLHLDHPDFLRMRKRWMEERRTSMQIKNHNLRERLGTEIVDVDLTLLYGKETQHFFKAVLQSFTVRGAKKGKR